MTWDSETGYIEYQTALAHLKTLLGLRDVDYLVRDELSPYVTKIIQYVVKRLIILDDTDIKVLLQEMFDIFDYGADLIVADNAYTLATEIPCIDVSEDDEVKYDQDRFIFSWANVMTALNTRLRLMYASLLVQTPSQGCCCCCGTGETTTDWEKFSSGVWPEDENDDSYCYNTSNTAWRTTAADKECNCETRLASSFDDGSSSSD